MEKFFDIYTKEEILNSITNRYLLFFSYKIEQEILISSEYEIVIRNINEIEKRILAQTLMEMIYDLLNLSDSLSDFLDKNKLKIIHDLYLSKYSSFDDRTIICFDLDGHHFSTIISKVLDIIKNYISLYSDELNYEVISKNIAFNYLENFVVLYSKNEEKIYELIKRHTGLSFDDIDWHDKYDEFFYSYINLWNAINFKQEQYLGIKIKKFDTHLETILNIESLENKGLSSECIDVLNNVNFIDIKDEKLFYFIVSSFKREEYLNDTNKILLYFSMIELLITHKPKFSDKDSIVKQIKWNIISCINEVKNNNYFDIINEIDNKEIDLLYNYRSIFVHGNFSEISKTLKKLEKYSFFQKYIIMNDIEDDEFKESGMVDVIRIRVLELFSYIYRLKMIDSEYVYKLKNNLTEKKVNFVACLVDRIKKYFNC